MTARWFLIAAIVVALLAAPPGVLAQTPVGTAFTYQGQLKQDGEPVNGNAEFEFRLYDGETGPGLIAQFGPVPVSVDDGLFTQELDFNFYPWTANEARWLEIAVDFPPGSGFVTLTPRQELTPAPFSLATRGINVDAVGNVGIGTASPGHRLHVVSSAITALRGETNSISTQAAGVVGVVASTSPGAYSAGLRGINNGTGGLGIGVWGSQDGSGWGVYGTSSAGRGVYGWASDLLGANYGVYGATASSEGWGGYFVGRGYFSGNVGIGTNAPAARLHIGGTPGVDGIMFPDGSFQTEAYTGVAGCCTLDEAYDQGGPGAGRTIFADAGAVTVEGPDGLTVSGDVGIGTDDPDEQLHVVGDAKVESTFGEMTVTSSGGERTVVYGAAPDISIPVLRTLGGGIDGLNRNGSRTLALRARSALDPYTSSVNLFRDDGTETVAVRASGYPLVGGDAGGFIQLRRSDGTSIITLDAGYDGPGGSGQITTQVLEITGGADLSEQFDIDHADGEVKPGLVVCIDPSRAGKLKVSRSACDRTVAGIVSGAGGVNPGMLMGQAGTVADGGYPVALSGRVWAWCDATDHPVEPGDLLTTSDTPGHAMKVTDYGKAQGAIIGKAMTALESGQGLVLVLVSLQ